MAEGKRSVFVEAGDADVREETPRGGLIAGRRRGARRAIRAWLLVLFALVTLMIAVGGLTRLTDSGLSITEWKPVTGAIPPLSEADWLSEFEKYKNTPEYQLQNRGMTLDQFKSIYWWEWGHRLLGRLIGLVWALGFLWFWLRGQIPPGWTGRLFGIGLLGGLQGAIGWWMVSSGLTGRMVDVASYRLATHLGIAFLILGLIAWFSFRLAREEEELLQARRKGDVRLARATGWFIALAAFQVLLGALVAGIDAGRGYIDWPLMNGEFLPSESFDYEPFWSNFFENPALVQFNHRMVGYLVFAAAIWLYFKARRSPYAAVRRAFALLKGVVILQVILGISTVMTAAQPTVALVHQLGAVAVIVLALRARFLALYPTGDALGRDSA